MTDIMGFMNDERDLDRSDWEGMAPSDGITTFLLKVLNEFELTNEEQQILDLVDAAKRLLEKEKDLNIELGGEGLQEFLESRIKDFLTEEEWGKIDDEEKRRHLAYDSYRAGVAG